MQEDGPFVWAYVDIASMCREDEVCDDEWGLADIESAVYLVEGFLNLSCIVWPPVDKKVLTIVRGSPSTKRELRHEALYTNWCDRGSF